MHSKLQFYIIIQIFFLNLYITLSFDTDANNTEIFVAYSGHSEAKDVPLPKTDEIDKDKIPEATHKPTEKKPEEEVVFIPNEKPVLRNEDEYLENNPVQLTDVMDNQRIGDVIRDDLTVTQSAKEEILFISGKNNENGEVIHKKSNKHTDTVTKTKDKERKRKRFDCRNLDCDNTIKSICGGKMEDKKWKFRSFLNECFFRKVNCAFRNPDNRYKLVELDKCGNIGNRSPRRPELQSLAMPLTSHIEETRRSFSSRRSQTADINGQSCSHACPVSCTEKYEPQCAVSSAGQRRTFLNHCKMDYDSCLFSVVWYIRPLSECVGGKKADVQQNRGFIAWMQKVGIVDGRGRLTISKGTHPRI